LFQLDANFLKVVSSAIVDKYIGESARLIREMFNYARDHQPCIIFMDEIDAIGGRRFSEGTSADREIQRTLMELLNQMDGFDVLGQVWLNNERRLTIRMLWQFWNMMQLSFNISYFFSTVSIRIPNHGRYLNSIVCQSRPFEYRTDRKPDVVSGY
jgi:hypothetical protein